MPPRSNSPTELMDTLSAPLGDLIAAVGRGVADAQRAMDAATIESFREIYEEGDGFAQSLRAIGYQPTWYRIPKAEAEITVSLSIAGQASTAGVTAAPGEATDGRLRLYATPIDATYTNKYEYDLRATSKLRFTIVPVPPTGAAAEMKFMPDVTRLSFFEACKLLEARGIAYQPVGDTKPSPNAAVRKSSPPAGGVVVTGMVVTLETV